MFASRVALSCEPTKRSTLSSSIRRTADFAVSAGGPPASVGISRTGRPMMPPALLIFSAARSAQARCVGPNSAAGPLSAMNRPILNSFAWAKAEPTQPVPSTAVPAATEMMRRRAGMNSLLMRYLLVVLSVTLAFAARTAVLVGLARLRARSKLRCADFRQDALDGRRDREQPRIGILAGVEFEAERQPGSGQRRGKADARYAGDAARTRIADERKEGRHAFAVHQHGFVVADRRRRQRRGRKNDGSDIVAPEMISVGRLQLRPQDIERMPVRGLGNRALAVQALQQPLHVRARALRDQLAIAHRRAVLLQIGIQIDDGFVEGDRKTGFAVEPPYVGDVGFDQHGACILQPRQHLLH